MDGGVDLGQVQEDDSHRVVDQEGQGEEGPADILGKGGVGGGGGMA